MRKWHPSLRTRLQRLKKLPKSACQRVVRSLAALSGVPRAATMHVEFFQGCKGTQRPPSHCQHCHRTRSKTQQAQPQAQPQAQAASGSDWHNAQGGPPTAFEAPCDLSNFAILACSPTPRLGFCNMAMASAKPQFEISSAQMFVTVQLFGTSCKIGIHNGGALSHKVGCHNFVHVLPCLVDWCSWYQQVGKAPRCGPSILQSRVDIMANGCSGMGVSIWPAHISCAIP